MDTQCEGTTKRTGERCKKAAGAFSRFCAQHDSRANTPIVAELPPLPEADRIAMGLPDDVEWHEAGATEQGWKLDASEFNAGLEEAKQQAKGFASLNVRSEPTPRCRERSCFKVRGHGGKHENGSQSVATCSAKACRLPLGHPDAHGVPAKERVRIGELTGKL